MSHLVAPSMLAANFGNLQADLAMLNASEADWYHIDIMDGVFVPNISMGFPVIVSINAHAQKPLDFHLMIVDPDKYLQACKDTGAYSVTVHYETCKDLHKTIDSIRKLGMKPGVVINPDTEVSVLKDYVNEVDIVLLMSVFPGFGGQKFIEATYDRVKELKTMLVVQGSKALIEVDGGVNLDNAGVLLDAGVDILVAGSSIFSTENQAATISKFKHIR